MVEKPNNLNRLLCVFLVVLIPLILGVKKNEKKDFDSIIKEYLFVNDFSQKRETRKVSDHLFWKYPMTIAPVFFPIDMTLDNPEVELPAVKGDGEAVYYLNYGRTEYYKGNYEKAKNIWLTCRQNFGKTHPHHRRADYYIALAFLAIAKQDLDAGIPMDDAKVRGNLANASTFLSWALIVKAAEEDKMIDKIAPKQFFNLAAIYYRYGRYAGAFGAAKKALEFLSKVGRKDFRPHLRRILAESHIKNRTYLEAVKQLDTAIRQDPDRKQAAAMFARVGDIYFDLNNYELAEYSYEMANRIGREANQINPAQYVLRGESLFWLGRFDEAQKNFHYALQTVADKNVVSALPRDYASKAHLRIADSYLALKKYDKAKLEYFRVMHQYRGTLESKIARVRNACLELPQFEGNNVKHARDLLSKFKQREDLPYEANELAWACEVGSYSQRERTTDMVNRVQEFYNRYPESKFLASLIEPVREVKADKLDQLFAEDKIYSAISYFEKTRDLLFKKPSNTIKKNLFVAYLDTFQAEKAAEFWPAYKTYMGESDLKKLRSATFLSEIAAKTNSSKWIGLSKQTAGSLMKHKWTIKESKLHRQYVYRSLSAKPKGTTRITHIDWAYNLVKLWANEDKAIYCSDVYPIVSKMSHAPKSHKTPVSVIRKDTLSFVDELLPSLLAIDETCGMSFLELEFEVLDEQPAELGRRYLKRRDWRISKPLATLFWEVAEINSTFGQPSIARDIWSIIRDKAPKDAPEVSFAKVRLDKSRTEYQEIWK